MSPEPKPAAPFLFLGLGRMGRPMALRLVEAGCDIRGIDPDPRARAAFEAAGGRIGDIGADAERAGAAILMLPDGEAVRNALMGEDGLARRLAPGALIVDMSSSEPAGTQRLAAELEALGFDLVDAPVSGGVRRAEDGSLAIMAGGAPEAVRRARPVLEVLGKAIFETGPAGSGHATKALNNHVSAAGLVAACEALIVGRAFGIAPDTLVEVLNASTGRNNSTEVKLRPFIISESYASGFALSLMAKDLAAAAGLAGRLGLDMPQMAALAALWREAEAALPEGADHTEIHRFLAALARPEG